MPILQAEISQYPEELFEHLPTDTADRRWWALYTKPRQEKCVARQLLEQQISFYLPLTTRTFVQRGRHLTSHMPLFAAYVFMYGSDEERVRCLATNRLARVLPVSDEVRLWDDLRHLQLLIASGAPLSIESRLMPGRRVRIRRGSLQGLEGRVISRLRETRLVVAVDFIQRGVSVEVDEDVLEPLD